MAGASGQYGKIVIGTSTLVECTKWTFDRLIEIFGYASCATSGYKRKVAGTRDGSGTLEGIYDPANRVDDFVDEGDSVTLKLYVSASKFYSVPAIVKSVKLEVNIETGDVERWTMDFEADGAWTKPT